MQAELNALADLIQGCFAGLILLVMAVAAIVIPILFPKLGFLFVWNKFLGAPLWNFLFKKRIEKRWRAKKIARVRSRKAARALPKQPGRRFSALRAGIRSWFS